MRVFRGGGAGGAAAPPSSGGWKREMLENAGKSRYECLKEAEIFLKAPSFIFLWGERASKKHTFYNNMSFLLPKNLIMW